MDKLDHPKMRAILFGMRVIDAVASGRKTQTRRLVKVPVPPRAGATPEWIHRHSPFGSPGEVLWVKEPFAVGPRLPAGACGPHLLRGTRRHAVLYWQARQATDDQRWVSPIYMPRSASRFELLNEGVQLTRLLELTDEDAVREGAHLDPRRGGWVVFHGQRDLHPSSPRESFLRAWGVMNGEELVRTNPWTFVLRFSVR